MAPLQGTADTASPKLLDSLKAYLGCWISLLKTRVEIIANELEEEQARLRQIVVVGVASAFFIAMGVLTLTFLVVAAFWDQRVAILTGFSLFYLAAGIGAALVVRHKIKTRPKLFSATLAELRKDQQNLS